MPVTVTASGEFGTSGLRNSAVMPLPPSWPHARDVSTTAPACWLPAGRVAVSRRAGHRGLCPALVAVRLVRQRDELADVRELGRELLEAPVDLGRVHVAGREVLLEVGVHRRKASTEPGLDIRLLEGAGARADAHARRPRRARRADVADADELSVLDVGVGRGVRVDVGRHHARVGADRRPGTGVPGERERRARHTSSRSVPRRPAGPWPPRKGSGPRSSRSSRRAGSRSRLCATGFRPTRPRRRSLRGSRPAPPPGGRRSARARSRGPRWWRRARSPPCRAPRARPRCRRA